MRVDVIEFAHRVNDRVFTIPAGTRLRERYVDANGQPCHRRDAGARVEWETLPHDVQVELHFDIGRIDRCLSTALNSRGGKARQGAVVVTIVKGRKR